MMLESALIFAPGPRSDTVRAPDGTILTPPQGWIFLKAGDAALTRRVKASGDHWCVKFKKGRKLFSKGVWAPQSTIDRIKKDLEAERATPAFARRAESSARRRKKEQIEYVDEFFNAVLDYLAFDPKYSALAEQVARAITDHATPVGSRTVARTERIPVAERAEAAVLAWMRHKTTDYDTMKMPRVPFGRRKTRKKLAQRSKKLLHQYRQGNAPEDHPLEAALQRIAEHQPAMPTI
jgi:hypothetical protein